MQLVTVTLAEANSFVESFHRHHKRVQGHKFSIGCAVDGYLVGVSIVGRPVSRHLDDGDTLEITRLCTNGCKNACSFLYARSAAACRALGYSRIYTYTLASEIGTSLKASGWKIDGYTDGGSWNCIDRVREDKHPTTKKIRWTCG